jgi:hypothetical protein
MPSPCPKCQSNKTASIRSTQRLALCAEAVNLLILARLKSCYPTIPRSATYQALEKLSQNLVEALAKSVQLKFQNASIFESCTHVCLRCGDSFTAAL